MSFSVSTVLFLFIINFFFIPIILSQEYADNEENKNLFENFNFGNLLWLDDTNTTSEIEKKVLIVFFYLNYCQYSYKYMPEFIRASYYAEEKNLPIKFAKIDAQKSQNINNKYKITAVPHIILFNKEDYYIFKEEISKEKLLEFIHKSLKNNIIEVEKILEINKIIKSSPLVVLSTIKNKNKMLFKSFEYYSKQETNIKFVSCPSDECKKKYYEDIILFKKFDQKQNSFTRDVGRIADADKNSVKDFVETFGIEAGSLVDQKILDMMKMHKRSFFLYFRDSNKKEHTQYDYKIKEIGMELRKKKIFSFLSDIKGEPFYENLVSSLNITKEDLPTLVFYDLKNSNIEGKANCYKISQVTFEKLNKNFINELINQIEINKNNKNNFTNTDIDLKNILNNYNVDGLERITEQNFDENVINNDINVVLIILEDSIFLPETKQILNIMKNLSKMYSKKYIKFAYIDSSTNQIPHIDFQDDIPPMVFLFINEKSQKKVFKMEHPNFEYIKQEEVINFINNSFQLNSQKNEEL